MTVTRGTHILIAATLAAVVPVYAAGSKAVKPLPLQYGERCFSCLRPITDRFTAAQAIAHPEDGHGAYKFRSIRCMLAFIEDAGATYEALYVSDYRDGTWLNVDEAVFVPIAIDTATGQPGYGIGEADFAAFGSWQAAQPFAAARGVKTMTWPAVVSTARAMPVYHDEQ